MAMLRRCAATGVARRVRRCRTSGGVAVTMVLMVAVEAVIRGTATTWGTTSAMCVMTSVTMAVRQRGRVMWLWGRRPEA